MMKKRPTHGDSSPCCAPVLLGQQRRHGRQQRRHGPVRPQQGEMPHSVVTTASFTPHGWPTARPLAFGDQGRKAAAARSPGRVSGAAAAPPAGPPRQARPRRRPRWAHTGGKSAGRERDGGYLASLTTSKTGRRWYAPITPKISTSAHVQSPPAPLRAAKTALKMRQMIQDRNSSLAHTVLSACQCAFQFRIKQRRSVIFMNFHSSSGFIE